MRERYILSMEHAAILVNMGIKSFRAEYAETNGKVFQIGRGHFTLRKDLEEWAAKNGREVSRMAGSSTGGK